MVDMNDEVRRRLQFPWSMQITVTYGCNYSCWFCGIHKSFNPKNWHHYRYVDPNLVAKVFMETRRWLPKIRVELDTHGEPTLHPHLEEVIRGVREDPRASIQLQTNGSLLEDWDIFEEKATKWFTAGLNLLCLNGYSRWWGKPKPGVDRYQLWMQYAQRYAATHPKIRVVDYYYNNEKLESPYHYHDPRSRTILVMDDLAFVNTRPHGTGGRSNKDIRNNCGNSTAASMRMVGLPEYPSTPLKARCTRVFREIIMEVDGHINLCCYDWRSQLVMGKFPDHSLKELWESDHWCAVRELLWRKNRNMSPCNVCDYNGGPRQGFIHGLDLRETDEQLQNVVARSMRRYVQYTHPSAGVFVGNHRIKSEVPGAYHY